MSWCFRALPLLASFLLACFTCSAQAETAAPITSIAISPDYTSLVMASQSGLMVRKIKSGASSAWQEFDAGAGSTYEIPTANIHAIRFSPTGTRLLICGGRPSESSFTGIYTWPDMQPLVTIENEGDSHLCGLWLDQDTIVTAGLDAVVRILESDTLSVTHELKAHSGGVTSLATFPEHRLLVSGGLDNSLRVWDLDDYTLQRSLNQHIKPVTDLAASLPVVGLPLVASASNDRTVRFWQPSLGRMVRFIKLPSKPQAITWLAENQLGAACSDGMLYVVDTLNVEIVVARHLKTGWCYDIDKARDRTSLFVSGTKGRIETVNTPSLLGNEP